jgi:hypothetical protein
VPGPRSQAVALVTDDFALYHRLAPFFEAHGIHLHGLRSNAPVPASTRVILGGDPADARTLPLRADAEANLLAVRAALDGRPSVRTSLRHVIVGVDPGQRIGLALLADGEVYLVAEALSPQEAVDRMVAWQEGLSPRHWSVHVGDGSPVEGARICAQVAARLPGWSLVIVPEQASTPGSVETLSRHTDAAVRLARRTP